MNLNLDRVTDAKPSKQKSAFPTTPRSQDMLKNELKSKLVKQITAHLRLKTQNQVLKTDNKELLQKAIVSSLSP